MRWIVDGMNVIGSRPDGWWKNRHRAMVALVERLERWTSDAAPGDYVTVVFERPPAPAIPSSLVEIAHAPKAAANSADDEIVRRVQVLVQSQEAPPEEIRVVTSDKTLIDRVRGLGASVCRAEGFRDLIDPQ
ncbi:NYN domain-containing protein [Mycobacterium spongiae]|uniref:RNA-binding protein n=1 Tax=Mycobacterium spongiae TaxID=886343 RepID=A0A975JXW4_9MYCO|nr:NYN domain-containing protein [Mycobacterium spongiae]QUR67702.1 RNA-binding protein [Mycobacterium spongiae]